MVHCGMLLRSIRSHSRFAKTALQSASKPLMRPSSAVGLTRSVGGASAIPEDVTKVRFNRFKAAILDPKGRQQIGLWSSLRSTYIAEMISHVSGFDWFVVDMEHAANDVGDVLAQLQVSQRGNAEPIVRVTWKDSMVEVKRVMDLGAQTILFPYVSNAEEAAAAVSYTRYPGLGGVRGVLSTGRMNMFGASNPHYYKEAASQVCVIVQVETKEALDNIEAMAAVDGVDGIFIGPSDLSASLGHIGNPGHPEVQEAIKDAVKRINATGKASGFLSGAKADCEMVLSLGCKFCAVGGDMAVLTNSCKALAADYHKFCKNL